MKAFVLLLILAIAGAAYYFFVYRPRHTALEARYVLTATLPLMDSPAEIRAQIGEAHAGERLEIISSTRNWAHVRAADGQQGWVESKNLLDAETFTAGQRLFAQVSQVPPQARGSLATDTSLRLDPSRDAAILSSVATGEPVEIVGRRSVARPAELSAKTAEQAEDSAPPREPGRDVWYLVRRKGQAGWLIGRYVSLSIPQEIGAYAQDVNLVAWVVLNRVEDNGTSIPEFVIADRGEDQDIDFDRIRVLTWWAARHHYVIAHVEGKLSGYFPILTGNVNGLPAFRLRLVGESGRKFQKVYGLYGTVIRVLGSVDGWESDTIPAAPQKAPTVRRMKRRASRQDNPVRFVPLRARLVGQG